FGANSVEASVQFLQTTGGVYYAPVILDYTDVEYPGSSTPLYRAYTVLTGQSYVVAGNPGGTITFTPTPATDIWLIDLLEPADSVKLNVYSMKTSTTENLAKYNGLGRKRVVV